MHRLLVAALFVPMLGSTAEAQTTGPYRLGQRDTLHYREVSDSKTLIETPQGNVTVSNEHEATIGLRGAGPGRATAWYETLRLHMVGPTGEMSPSTDDILGRPYSLAFPSDGRVRMTEAPPIPDPIMAVTDLRHEFDDFFVTMPPTRPSAGAMWQDTVRSEGSGPNGGTQSLEAIRRYKVRGDTSVAGVRALVVEVASRFEAQSSAPMQGQPITVHSRLSGDETGIVLFDWADGRLLARTKEGRLEGTMRMTGGPQPVEFPQSMTYTSSITAGPGGG